MATVHVAPHLKNITYWGSKKIVLDGISVEDARYILKETPGYAGLRIIEDVVGKPKSKKKK